jgi:hypothetical protein
MAILTGLQSRSAAGPNPLVGSESRNPPSDRPIDPKWDRWIDATLTVWGLSPAPVPDEDDGFLMPVRAAVDTACAVALRFRDQRLPAPDDVVANGDGGIFFHWGKPGETFETFEFVQDGSGTYTQSEQLRRVATKPFTRQVLRESIYG